MKSKNKFSYNKKSMSRRKIQWDEVTIAEHDKERGTRQKIDEPPTPYAYDSEIIMDDNSNEVLGENDTIFDVKDGRLPRNNSDEMMAGSPPRVGTNGLATKGGVMDEWETLNARLTYEQQLQKNVQRIENNLNEIGEFVPNDNNDEGQLDSTNDSGFASKRAAHYNEFKVLQAMRAKMNQDDDDDDHNDHNSNND